MPPKKRTASQAVDTVDAPAPSKKQKKAPAKPAASSEATNEPAAPEVKETKKKEKETEKAAPAAASSAGGVNVHITSSKVCNAFKSRAEGLAAAVKKANPSAVVEVDHAKPEGRKPDRGSFVVVVNGKTLVECRSMPRPFNTMKALDMEDVAKKVIAAL